MNVTDIVLYAVLSMRWCQVNEHIIKRIPFKRIPFWHVGPNHNRFPSVYILKHWPHFYWMSYVYVSSACNYLLMALPATYGRSNTHKVHSYLRSENALLLLELLKKRNWVEMTYLEIERENYLCIYILSFHG